jgi:hypothetical protein
MVLSVLMGGGTAGVSAGGGELDRTVAFERFVEQTLLHQEALHTKIVQVDDAEVTQQIRAVQQQPEPALDLEHAIRARALAAARAHPATQTADRACLHRAARSPVCPHV